MTNLSPEEWYRQGFMLHQAGRLVEAEGYYREALKADPRFFNALHLLGTLYAQVGETKEAVRLLGEAVAVNAASSAAFNNYGNALRTLGRKYEALAAYGSAIALKPDYVNALYNRGALLQEMGRDTAALADYDRAIALKPDYANAHCNRGTLLEHLKRYDEALESLDKALALSPDYAEAYYNRGIVLQALKRPQEALAAYDRAVALKPNDAETLNNRGNALRELKRMEEALVCYDRALELNPGVSETLVNRGMVLHALERFDEAIDAYLRAIAVKTTNGEAFHHLGTALQQINRMDEALASLDKAIELKPDDADIYYSRGNIYQKLSRWQEALADHSRAVELDPGQGMAASQRFYLMGILCDWERRAEYVADLVRRVDDNEIVVPFALLSAVDDPDLHYRGAKTISQKLYPPQPLETPRGKTGGRMKLAYLCGEFIRHPVAVLIAELLERHDRSQFEVYGIALSRSDQSSVRARIEKSCDRFVDAHAMSDRAVAALLAEEGIGIAIDLNGHTGMARPSIFARQPAPIAVNYLGYAGTTGASYMDYVLADSFVIPAGSEAYFSESVARLPGSYLIAPPLGKLCQAPSRAEAGLPEKGLVLCCFNNSYKITPDVFDVWMRILKEVPESVLWSNVHLPPAMENLRKEAMRRGIASERLCFAPRVESSEEYLARLQLADLFLDTLPYNAHSTALDALTAGVPVLTCAGKAFPGRVAGSLLSTIGLPELIAVDMAQYEALALALAQDAGRLKALRTKLWENRTSLPLFDADRSCRDIERAYREMWRRHCKGEAPGDFVVGEAI